MIRDNRGQWAIIELVVVVAIIAAAAYFIYPSMVGGGGIKMTPGANGASQGEAANPPNVLQRAQGIACQNNLKQIRDAINMYAQANEKFPDSLAELGSYGISGDITKCPVSGTPYSYDPASGRVWCTTPWHEKY